MPAPGAHPALWTRGQLQLHREPAVRLSRKDDGVKTELAAPLLRRGTQNGLSPRWAQQGSTGSVSSTHRARDGLTQGSPPGAVGSSGRELLKPWEIVRNLSTALSAGLSSTAIA